MKTDITKSAAYVAEADVFLGENWFDPLEAGVRTRIRGGTDKLTGVLGCFEQRRRRLVHPCNSRLERGLWRLPSQPLAQIAVDDSRTNLQHAMCSLRRSLHLLLLDHALGYQRVDSRLGKRRSDSSARSVTDAVIDYRTTVRTDIGE